MKRRCYLLVCWCLAVASAHAGTITGTVTARPRAGLETDPACGAYDSRKFKFVERVNYAELRDFVVYVEGKMDGAQAPPEKPAQVVTQKVSQKGAIFMPRVLPVMVGTVVEWPNYDEILHNVFSFSEAKPFDLGLYKSPDVGRVTFDKPGRVDVFCSIHARMSCIVLVLENPYFASTDKAGTYRITNVPPGTYRLKAWHERLPAQVREITVPETGEVKADFVLGLASLPKS